MTVPQATNPIELFFSYSHKDDGLRDELARHLALLRRQGAIDDWHDRRIGAGEEWKGAIDAHLDRADIVLLLVSPDFMASDYCFDIEMTRALGRSARGEAIVIPILVRPTDWTGAPFAHLQALPKDAKPVTRWADRDEAWVDVVQGIRRALDRLDRARRVPTDSKESAKTPPGEISRPAVQSGDSTPTRASLRRLLGAVLTGDSDLEAFCLDHFPRTHQRFSRGMDRVEKTNLILQHEDLGTVLARLRQHDEEAFARHAGLLRYE